MYTVKEFPLKISSKHNEDVEFMMTAKLNANQRN